jgi:alpha-galactosidase
LHNRWWLNDPDCLILRPDADLTLPEIQSLATTIAITGGAFFLTDDLAELPQTRLGIAAKLVPPIGKRARVLDWIDKTTPELLRLDLENQTGRWHLLAVFNWGDVPQDRNLQWEAFDLPERDYFARDFWNGVTRRISDGVVHLAEIPPHGVRLLSVRPIMPGNPSYLGSDLHISQGLCVTEWQILSGGGLRCRIERPGTANGVADLHLPQPPVKATLNNQESTWERIEAGIYRFPVRFDQQADLEIEWD